MERLLVITGPTATGKTDLAIKIAKEINGDIISADSRQVYAGMNIGTAKPKFAWSDKVINEAAPAADRNHSARRGNPYSKPREAGRATQEKEVASSAAAVPSQEIPHYLFNIRYPNQPLSLSEWQALAFAAIDEVSTPLLVGGTMLYIDSILKNYDLPQVPPNETLRTKLEAMPVEELYAKLLGQDPAAEAFIQPQNKRRIIRALEVMEVTGEPFSQARRQRPPRYEISAVGLFDSWEALEKRITARIDAMFAYGLVAETTQLIKTYGEDLPLLQTMNYRETAALLRNELSEEEAKREMLRANMRYARRQMSWWRGRSDIAWYSPLDFEGIKKRLLG